MLFRSFELNNEVDDWVKSRGVGSWVESKRVDSWVKSRAGDIDYELSSSILKEHRYVKYWRISYEYTDIT